MKSLLLISLFSMFSLLACAQGQQVSFPSGNLTLNGTLTIPAGPGPFPVVVFVHGSGPNDRDQTLHVTGGNARCLFPGLYNDTIRNFKDLAEELQVQGVAVLRYDKRTFSHVGQINPLTISPLDFIADVHAALDYVKLRTEIDSNCMSLLGHSQGASFIPIVANNRTDIRSVIGLGTPVTRIDTLYAQQYRDLHYICVNDTVTGDAFYQSILADFAKIRNGTWGNSNPYEGAFPKFWNDWMDIGESTINEFQKVKVPVLIVHGMNDFNVPLTDAQKLEASLTAVNKKMIYLPGINHYLTNSSSPKVAQVVHDSIFNFINIYGCKTTHVSIVEEANLFTSRQDGTQFFVRLNSSNLQGSLSVYDMLGRLCLSRELHPNTELCVDLKRFQSGIYGIYVRSNSKTETIKLWVP